MKIILKIFIIVFVCLSVFACTKDPKTVVPSQVSTQPACPEVQPDFSGDYIVQVNYTLSTNHYTTGNTYMYTTYTVQTYTDTLNLYYNNFPYDLNITHFPPNKSTVNLKMFKFQTSEMAKKCISELHNTDWYSYYPQVNLRNDSMICYIDDRSTKWSGYTAKFKGKRIN